MTFAAIYMIVVGLGMIGLWVLSIARRQVPEFATEPFRIGFHLAAEFATAAALLVGGSALFADTSWASEAGFVPLGMLLYTVIVSPGYFAQKRQWPMVGMFAVLLVLALVSLGLLL